VLVVRPDRRAVEWFHTSSLHRLRPQIREPPEARERGEDLRPDRGDAIITTRRRPPPARRRRANATAPDSNAPSSFDALMNTHSTALTRPWSCGGVSIVTAVWRMLTLTMSTNPLRASAASDSGNHLEKPKTIIEAPKVATTTSSVGPAGVRSGLRGQQDGSEKRADRRSRSQDAEPDRAHMQDRAREHGRERDRVAEQHAEEIEADRPEQHPRTRDEPDARDEAVPAGRLGGYERAHDRAHREDGGERQHKESRGGGVHGDRLDGEDDPAECGPRDHADLPRDAAQGEAPGSSSCGTISGVRARARGCRRRSQRRRRRRWRGTATVSARPRASRRGATRQSRCSTRTRPR